MQQEAVFTRVKTCYQPRCPLTGKCINLLCMYTMRCLPYKCLHWGRAVNGHGRLPLHKQKRKKESGTEKQIPNVLDRTPPPPKASINDHGWEDGSACKRLAPDKLSVSPRTRKGKGELTTTSYPLTSM